MDLFNGFQTLLTSLDTAVTAVGTEIAALEATITQLQTGGTLTAAEQATLTAHITAIQTALTALEPPVVTPPAVGS